MLSALLIVSSSSAHVSLVPNYGAASGGYFQTSIKVPHGHSGVHTTKMILHVPRGIVSIKPEQPAGWSVATTTYELLGAAALGEGITSATFLRAWSFPPHQLSQTRFVERGGTLYCS